MLNLGKKIEAKNRTFAVIGEALAGKTTLIAKDPKAVFLSFDGNAKYQTNNWVEPKSYQEIIDLINQISQDDDYDAIVIDTAEDMSDILEKEVISQGDKPDAESLAEAGAFGKASGIFKNRLNNIVALLNKQNKEVYYLFRGQKKDGNIVPTIRDNWFSILSGHSDGVISIENDHTAKFVSLRYPEAIIPEILNEVVNLPKQKNELLEKAQQKREQLLKEIEEKKVGKA